MGETGTSFIISISPERHRESSIVKRERASRIHSWIKPESHADVLKMRVTSLGDVLDYGDFLGLRESILGAGCTDGVLNYRFLGAVRGRTKLTREYLNIIVSIMHVSGLKALFLPMER